MANRHDKHYTSGYLDDTAELLHRLKKDSYQVFSRILEGESLMDLGCGTGLDVVGLAENFRDKDIQVIGVDHDPDMIKKALERETDSGNLQFILSEVSKLPFQAGSIGGVRAERLTQHIEELDALFAEINRILKPGGALMVVETDWKSLVFYNGDGHTEGRINDYLTYTKVKNGMVARKLFHYFRSWNFTGVSLKIHPFILNSYSDACKYLWIDRILDEMISQNLLSKEESEKFVNDQYEAEELGGFRCSINMILISGIRHEGI